MNVNSSKKRMPDSELQCKAVTRKGLPCKNTPSKDSAYCYLHCAERFHWSHLLKNPIVNVLSLIITIIAFVFGFIQYNQSVKNAGKNRVLTAKNTALIEGNRSLLESLVTNKYEKDLQEKYPGGYALFGVDYSRTYNNKSIPHSSNLLEEYEFDWSPVRISEVTETKVTVEMPHIHYKPLKTKLFSTAMIIPKYPKGQSWIYPPKPKGTKNRIFIELIEYNDPFYAFAIGFKPE